MTYQISLTSAAVRQLKRLDREGQRRIQAALDLLANEPRPPRAIKLAGVPGQWRVRTGDYRIVYEVHDETILILVLAIGHRREIYGRRP